MDRGLRLNRRPISGHVFPLTSVCSITKLGAQPMDGIEEVSNMSAKSEHRVIKDHCLSQCYIKRRLVHATLESPR